MSEQLREQLSAMMDGELPADQTRFLLRRIGNDAQLAQSWSRYQIVGSVMRREALAVSMRANFSQIVMQQISDSPGPMSHGVRALRWVGGGAIAAAAAAVALVAFQPGKIGMPRAMETVASAPAPAVVSRPIDLRAPVVPSPILMNFDYAQPASYDTQFEPLARYSQYGTDPMRRFSPYLLTRAPAQSVSKPASAQVPAH